MGKKRKDYPRETPEDRARFEETSRMVKERIADHEAKAREQEAMRIKPHDPQR